MTLTRQEVAKHLLRLKKASLSFRGFCDLHAARYIPQPKHPDGRDYSPQEFQKYLDRLIRPPFQDNLISVLNEVELGNKPRLLITMPPGSAKSTYATKLLPAYYMARDPRRKLIIAAYGSDLAREFGGEAQHYFSHPFTQQAFPASRLLSSQSAKDDWMTTEGGKCFSGGAMSGITGHRGSLIIDDPIKNRLEAESPTYRQRLWKEYISTLSSRPLEGQFIICILCLTGDTPVSMADGTIKALRDVIPGNTVISHRDGSKVANVVTAVSSQGEDDVIEVRTKRSSIKGNARHPILIDRGGVPTWVPISDLKVGDMAVTALADIHHTAISFTTEEAWTLGYMHGDGWVTVNTKTNKNRTTPTQSLVTCIADCPKYLDRVQRAMAYLSDRFECSFKKTAFGYYRSEKAALGRYMLRHGLNAGAHHKRVPPSIFRQHPDIRQAFLDGFMAADGCFVSKAGNQEHHNAAGGYNVGSITTCNEALAHDIRHLTRSLGYPVTNVCRHTREGQPPNSKEPKEWTNFNFKYHHLRRSSATFSLEPITSITPAGRAEVFDLSVAGDENFIADGICVHNTRWHPDDLAGRLMKSNLWADEGWEHLEIQAIQEREADEHMLVSDLPPDDPRYVPNVAKVAPGKRKVAIREEYSFWPTLFPLKSLQARRTNDPREFQALFQQRPTLEGGNMIRQDWWQFFTPDEYSPIGAPTDVHLQTVIVGWDTAYKEKELNDFNAGLVGALGSDGNIYLLNMHRARMVYPDLKRRVIEVNRFYRGRGLKGVYIEDKASGQSLIQDLKTETGIAVIPWSLPGSKTTRAATVSDLIRGGRVFLPLNKPWVDEFIQECGEFPDGSFDDQVDALVIVLDALSKINLNAAEQFSAPIENLARRPDGNLPLLQPGGWKGWGE